MRQVNVAVLPPLAAWKSLLPLLLSPFFSLKQTKRGGVHERVCLVEFNFDGGGTGKAFFFFPRRDRLESVAGATQRR